MRFSIVNGEKREAEKGLSGLCVGCSQPTIPKCGPIKVKHWAHKAKCECDRWWENETEWHRNWKNHFTTEWQEVRQRAGDGEWHIADVKTVTEYVIEFQHSFLKQEERTARNIFYGQKFSWVVDGLLRKNDRSEFEEVLKGSKQVLPNIPLIQIPSVNDCSLLRDWSECSAFVFFDFGGEFPLWCLLPKSSKGLQYLLPVPRQQFVGLHLQSQVGKDYSSFENYFKALVFAYENPQPVQVHQPQIINRPLPRRQIVPQSKAEARALYNMINRSPGGRRQKFRF